MISLGKFLRQIENIFKNFSSKFFKIYFYYKKITLYEKDEEINQIFINKSKI